MKDLVSNRAAKKNVNSRKANFLEMANEIGASDLTWSVFRQIARLIDIRNFKVTVYFILGEVSPGRRKN